MLKSERVQLATVLLVFTGLIYLAVWRAAFVFEDRNWLAILDGNISPTLHLSFWTLQLNTWASGASPLGYHLANLGLHLANGLLVLSIARALLTDEAAFLAMGLFLLHPLQVEAVAYISARPDLLSTMFALAAMRGSIALCSWRPTVEVGLLAAGVFAAGAGAVLAKPTAIAIVPLIGWLVIIYGTINRDRLALLIGVGTIVTLVACAWTPLGTIVPVSNPPTVEFAGLQSLAVWRMVGLVIIPFGFSVDHDYALVTPVFGFLALAALLGVGYVAWTQRKHQFFALTVGWTLIAVAPRLLMAGVYHPQQPELLNEHQFYLASVGMFLGLAGLAERWSDAPAPAYARR